MNDRGGMKIFKNLDIRIVSLILAVTLWLYASSEKYYKLSFHCQVEVMNVPQGYSLARCLSPVLCEIEAKGRDLIAFQFKNPKLVVDADNRQVKRLRIKLSQENLSLPFNLKIKAVSFAESDIEISMDRQSEKQVNVAVDVIGDPADGFVLSDSINSMPPIISLMGPAKQLDFIDTVYTMPVRIDRLSEETKLKAGLILPDTCLFKVKPESVEVVLRFEKSGERVFKNIPLSVVNRSKNYLVSFAPGTIDLVVSGPKNLLDAARPSDMKISLDLNGLQPGKYQLQASIELPEKLILIAASPRDFEVTIK